MNLPFSISGNRARGKLPRSKTFSTGPMRSQAITPTSAMQAAIAPRRPWATPGCQAPSGPAAGLPSLSRSFKPSNSAAGPSRHHCLDRYSYLLSTEGLGRLKILCLSCGRCKGSVRSAMIVIIRAGRVRTDCNACLRQRRSARMTHLPDRHAMQDFQVKKISGGEFRRRPFVLVYSVTN
jgi:hypothetical protein